MNFIVLLGRIFFSAIFLIAAFGHFSEQTIQYAANSGVPMASFLVPLSGIIAFLGALSILLGYKAKYGAWLLVVFLVPVTLMIHKFWGIDPANAPLQQVMFMKNLSMLGGALLITYFGSGPLSLDRDQ
ncbi:MAG: DoxX family protein [Parachlamydiaceae bacterium]|nr:DoxX family protein [Parachlamydiaceae bacterium]